jgi:glycosyltransferase involved in cell wall biosynthesis
MTTAPIPNRIGVAWQIGTEFGWGQYGWQIVRRLSQRGDILPIPLVPPASLDLDGIERAIWAPARRAHKNTLAAIEAHGNRRLKLDMPLLHARGNGGTVMFAGIAERLRGRRNHALVFLENTAITSQGMAAFRRFDRIVAGSRWNRHVLEGWGFSGVVECLQGVDPSYFHPAPRPPIFPGRFVVFSAGKLEYRKGQDIVAAAMRIFCQRHPDAMLLALWNNRWPASDQARLFRHSPHLQGTDPFDSEGAIDWARWLRASGLDPGRHWIVTDPVAHGRLARLIRAADVALFPNRCEGGTNLAAMETMAAGVPTILAANTGQLDIVVPDGCYPLARQRPVALPESGLGREGWGESDLEEIVEALETAYRNRDSARAVGLKGAAAMHRLAWSAQVDKLVNSLDLA